MSARSLTDFPTLPTSSDLHWRCSATSQLGAENLVWGSDMPNVERFCTYKQSLDYVRHHCDFLSARELDLVLGGNLKRVFELAAPSAPAPPD
jgi:hypothetical protein